MERMELDKLLFRRQFISGPDGNLFPQWDHASMPDGSTLSAHPDLQLTDYHGKHFRFVLLGYILDPYHPERDNTQVLAEIDENALDLPNLFEKLYDKSGHFILFAYQGAHGIVLNDAGGLKQIYYHRGDDGKTWFTSHAAILANHLNLPISPEADQFIHSAKYKKKLEPWFPADTSPYSGVQRLIPNHYLDLDTLTQVRFWPIKKLKKYTLADGTRIVGDLIKGTCQAGFNRFPAALTLTGGFDSRVILAGCKDYVNEIDVFTMLYRQLTEESEDLIIAKKIASAFDLNYRFFKCDQEVPADFLEVYQRSTEGYKTDWMNLVYARFNNVSPEKVIFKGNIAEAIRCDFWPDGMYPVEVTVDTLVDASALGDDPYVYTAMERWMREAQPYEKYGYKLLDLFAWEIEAGSWQAMSHSIFGLAHEEFSPFGNRKLLDTSLGVHKRHRCWPDIRLEQEVTKYLWPNLAEFPYFSSWSMHGYKKKFYDGDLLNFLRKVRHHIKRRLK